MSALQRRESIWFNEVISKFLDGKTNVRVERLSDKQVAVFSKFMVSDRTDYNGRRSVYESEDGQYIAVMDCRKYCTNLKVYDNALQQVENFTSLIKSLVEEMEEDRTDGITDYLEVDTKKLNGYKTELNKWLYLVELRKK